MYVRVEDDKVCKEIRKGRNVESANYRLGLPKGQWHTVINSVVIPSLI